jgi:hypothetical protein
MKSTGRGAFDKVQAETFIVFPPRKLPAAGEAGDGSADPANSQEMPLTTAATIHKSAT